MLFECKEQASVEKIWLKSYPPGVPAEINPDAYQSLVEVFELSCREHSYHPAFYNMGIILTYTDLNRYTRDFAAYLQKELKASKGMRIAIMLPNILQYPVAMFGGLRAGLTIVNINPLYTSAELISQVNNSGAEIIITVDTFAHTLEKALPQTCIKHVIITQIGDLFPPIKAWFTNLALKYYYKSIPNWHIPHAIAFTEVLARGSQLPYSPANLSGSDIAFLQYTGGTTGVSKGAILTHRNIVANIQQADAWFKHLLSDSKEIIITALPLYHIFSLTANCLYFLKIGGLNILITNPRNVSGMIKEMKKLKFTAITGVNTLFNALLKHPKFHQLDFSQLRFALGGGMAVQKVVAEKWQEVTKSPLLEAYGLTETSPCVTINPPNISGYNSTVGLPVPSTDISILDEEYNELPIDVPGELAVKGPQVMQGYWRNPEETQKAFTKDGYLLTGDIASIDAQGFIRLLERKKDMILVSGFNVYPNEVEDVLVRLKGVREVAVVGIPDENSGEAVKAFIVRDDPNLTKADVSRHAHEFLTHYKVPKQIEFCPELPKSYVGKILRRALRNQ